MIYTIQVKKSVEDVTISRRLLISCRKMLLTCRIFFFRVAIFFIFPSKNFFHDKGKGQVCIWKHENPPLLTGRAAAQCSQKGSRIFLDKIDPENGDISPISAAAQVFTKPSVLLDNLRRLYSILIYVLDLNFFLFMLIAKMPSKINCSNGTPI